MSPLTQRHILGLMYLPVLLLSLLVGSMFVAARWTRAPAAFDAVLARKETVERIKRYRRWLKIWHRY